MPKSLGYGFTNVCIQEMGAIYTFVTCWVIMGTALFSFRPDVPDPSKIVNIDLFLDFYQLFWYIYRLIRHVKPK